MQLTVEGVLRALMAGGAAAPAFKELFEQVVGLFHGQDQATLKEAYADAMADNDEGHRRLQEKLAAL